MCGLPSTVRSYYCNHVANTNQILQLNTQRHAYYTCTPRVYSHRHSGELAPNPTSVTIPIASHVSPAKCRAPPSKASFADHDALLWELGCQGEMANIDKKGGEKDRGGGTE